MDYQNFDRKIISNFDQEYVSQMYRKGYVFGRIEKGQMDQVLSLKINLENFEFNSENRRIARKTEWLKFEAIDLPIKKEAYDFNIHKLGKEFYERKNEEKVFSASKIKELVTSEDSNFNLLLKFFDENKNTVGYVICYKTKEIFHYAYPFYNLDDERSNIGMGMIIKTIEYAKSLGLNEFYLGSVNNSKNLYKLQFENSFWWNKDQWEEDVEKLKEEVKMNSVF